MNIPFPNRTAITAAEYRRWLDGDPDGRHALPTPRQRRETAFRDAVVLHAKNNGWRCHWTHDSRHSPAGWPDLTLCRSGQLIFAELKVPPNRLTAAQREWIALLAGCGQRVYVWTPDMWSEIERVLA